MYVATEKTNGTKTLLSLLRMDGEVGHKSPTRVQTKAMAAVATMARTVVFTIDCLSSAPNRCWNRIDTAHT